MTHKLLSGIASLAGIGLLAGGLLLGSQALRNLNSQRPTYGLAASAAPIASPLASPTATDSPPTANSVPILTPPPATPTPVQVVIAPASQAPAPATAVPATAAPAPPSPSPTPSIRASFVGGNQAGNTMDPGQCAGIPCQPAWYYDPVAYIGCCASQYEADGSWFSCDAPARFDWAIFEPAGPYRWDSIVDTGGGDVKTQITMSMNYASRYAPDAGASYQMAVYFYGPVGAAAPHCSWSLAMKA